jgi:hypothetical protein
MKLSGSVGYTLLVLDIPTNSNSNTNSKSNSNYYNNNQLSPKYVLLLSDIHDGVKYCIEESIMIDKWLNSKDNNDILLEEIVDKQLNLTDLWPSSIHTKKLKELNQNNPKIKPIDIRPLLIPFSWEIVYTNKKLEHVTLKEYISELDNLFSLKKTHFFMTYIYPEVKKLKSKEIFKVSLITHFNELKNIFEEFKKENNEYMNKTILYIYNLENNLQYNNNLLETINNITSMVMEWYILLLIHNSDNNTIIHIGLAHSDKILELLKDVYQFKIIKESGINRMIDIDINNDACINIPQNITNLF